MRHRNKALAPRRHEGTRCWKDGKKIFKTVAHAMNRAAQLITRRGWASNEARAYLCEHCGGYHLTSKPKL